MKKDRLGFSSLARLYQYCNKYTPLMIICGVMTLATSAISIYTPTLVSDITDTMLDGVLKGLDVRYLTEVLIKLAIFTAISAVVSYAFSTICDYISQKTSFNLRHAISEKLTRMPLSFFDRYQRGELLSRTTTDVETVSGVLTKNVTVLLSSAVLFTGALIKMFATNIKMAFIAIGMSILSAVIMVVLALISRKYYVATQNTLGEMTAYLEEAYNNHLLIKLFHTGKYEKGRFDGINKRMYDSHWKSASISVCTSPILSFIDALSVTIITVMGCALFLSEDSELTFGQLTAFLIYADMFSSPLSTIAGILSSLQKTAASADRIFGILDSEEQPYESDKLQIPERISGDIQLDCVSFAYEVGKPVIQNLSLSVKRGEKIAIVGPSGAGKTTLVNLLMRFYEVDSGEIRIDGVPITEYSRESVRSLFDMVLQDTWLFDGTVRENLTFGDSCITEEKLDSACEAVGISHLIKMLPKGYDTELNQLTGLSEGQRQQLAIVRMLLKNAPFLIFDEATSSLDSGTEMRIQSTLQHHMEGKTCFIIAHRLSTVSNVDRIAVIENGTVAESGTHAELMALKGLYYSMYTASAE